LYARPTFADLFSEPLVRLDKNFTLQPAAAESWTSSEDSKIWIFKIRRDLMWSDGNPVTAHDWVATFRYAADPAHAWDFTWYFRGVIKHWTQALDPASGVAPDQIGVRVGPNEYELIVETDT